MALDCRSILQYFIDYEKMTGLMENSLSKVEGQTFSRERLKDAAFLQERVHDKKTNEIVAKIMSYKYMNSRIEEQGSSRDALKAYAAELVAGAMSVAAFLEKAPFKFEDDKDNSREFIESLLADPVTVCSPLLKKKTRQEETLKPLLTFICSIEDGKLAVEHFYINRESLEVIVASFAGCSTTEVGELEKTNLLELMNANERLKQPDLFEIMAIFEAELRARYGKGLSDFRTFDGWQKLESAFVTFQTLEEVRRPIFQKELQRILHVTAAGQAMPELLADYLATERDAAAYSREAAGRGWHYGSYTNRYSINEKQWHIIEAAERHSCLSVNGPPGTGKSTLLKEMFADTMVKKAAQLLRIWEQPWDKHKERSCEMFRMPLPDGERTYSMVLTSTNNKAVDNIGLELLKEIKYFSEFAEAAGVDLEQQAGYFCGRLGNFTNKEEFMKVFARQFIQGLESAGETDSSAEARSIQQQFQQAYDEAAALYEEIDQFLQARSNIGQFFQTHGLELTNVAADRDRFHSVLKEQERQATEWKERGLAVHQEFAAIDKQVAGGKQQLASWSAELSGVQESIKRSYGLLEKHRSWSKLRWLSWVIPPVKSFFQEYPSESYIANRIIQKLETEEAQLQTEQERLKQEITLLEEQAQAARAELEELKKRRQLAAQRIQLCRQGLGLLETYVKLEGRLQESRGLENVADKDRCALMQENVVLSKRYELFELALRVNEAYVRKHAAAIIRNLKVVVQDKWFQPLFNEGNKRDIEYATGIRALWNTLFLCFPVITSTLHSFGESTFHLLPGLIDTLYVDEAGQIMPHYLAGPLYRSTRAVIVGDIEQLEPVRLLKTNVVEQTSYIPEPLQEALCVQRNSAQSYADRSSDVYEHDHQGRKKGIILIEHRRCEKTIMLFSNKYVYGNILTIVNEDRHDKWLGRNLVSIDVRGLKDIGAHANQAEIRMCRRLVDAYVQAYGEGIRGDIGIITPFSAQRDQLQSAIQGVDVGTVHAFQGQEKKIIIFSAVLDGVHRANRGLAGFVGAKTNLLNVALSRAKEQFVLVGNLEAISALSGNHLSHVLDIVLENGISVSPFQESWHTVGNEHQAEALLLYTEPMLHSDGQEEASGFAAYVREHIPHRLLLQPREHHQAMLEALRLASSSLTIFSPWIMSYVVDEAFIELVREALRRNVDLRIAFGYQGGKEASLQNIAEIVRKDYNSSYGGTEKIASSIAQLKELMGTSLHYIPPIHTKLLLVDERYLFVGSHNWLAKLGTRSKRDEVSCLITEEKTIQYLKERYIQLKLA